jgi:hypothetical protein
MSVRTRAGEASSSAYNRGRSTILLLRILASGTVEVVAIS